MLCEQLYYVDKKEKKYGAHSHVRATARLEEHIIHSGKLPYVVRHKRNNKLSNNNVRNKVLALVWVCWGALRLVRYLYSTLVFEIKMNNSSLNNNSFEFRLKKE